jgi:GNAT superfamily N-acetyltransferase
VRLRPATRDDLRALVRLTRRCDESHRQWAGTDLPMPREDVEELEWELRLARSDAWVRIAEDEADGAVVGAIALAGAQVSRDDPARVPGVAHISALFVDPGHWRRGIARALLDAAEEAMRASGYDRVQLWTLEGSPAEKLYAALGWERDGRRDVFAPMGLPTVAYVKTLR